MGGGCEGKGEGASWGTGGPVLSQLQEAVFHVTAGTKIPTDGYDGGQGVGGGWVGDVGGGV